jgi:hypothetical protein
VDALQRIHDVNQALRPRQQVAPRCSLGRGALELGRKLSRIVAGGLVTLLRIDLVRGGETSGRAQSMRLVAIADALRA